jgi:hypothetical protein
MCPFRDVVGHVQLIDLLSRSVDGRTPPPSLLFAGRPGRQAPPRLQRAGAQLFRVQVQGSGSGFKVRVQFDACGTCAACTRIERGVHPDVLFVAPRQRLNQDRSGARHVDCSAGRSAS